MLWFESCWRGACSESTATTLVGQYQSQVRHVPGYTGHVPELKHSVGQTYGSATSELVTRPLDAKADRKAMNKASLDRFASGPGGVTLRPELNIEESGLYLKYR